MGSPLISTPVSSELPVRNLFVRPYYIRPDRFIGRHSFCPLLPLPRCLTFPLFLPAKMTTTAPNGIHTPTPPGPSKSIDWDNIGFKIHKVNGHAHATWSDGKWSNVEFRQDEMLSIHGFASCLNYGQQCFEGLKAFRNKDGQIRIFRPDENALRLAHSARMIYAPPVPEELFLEAVHLA